MEKIMLYVDFDTKTIGYCPNRLDWSVGEFTKKNGRKVMVYANFDLSRYGLKTFKYVFKRGLRQFDNFCDKLNYCVEELIRLTATDDFGRSLIEDEEAIRARKLHRLIEYMESRSIGATI